MPVTGAHIEENDSDRRDGELRFWADFGGRWMDGLLLEREGQQRSTLLDQLRRHYHRMQVQRRYEGLQEAEPCPFGHERGGDRSTSSSDYNNGDTSMIEALDGPSSSGRSRCGPVPCSYMCQGQSFVGAQRMKSQRRQEDWRVKVQIHDCDFHSGFICGTIEATDVPSAKSPILTYWEGEILNNHTHTFVTGKWGASVEIDRQHWSKFEGYAALQRQVDWNTGCSPLLSSCSFIFMRWKEQFFVNVGADCGLTIDGFYYVCLNRLTGAAVGYYFDPHSSPYQELQLVPSYPAEGMAFSTYSFS